MPVSILKSSIDVFMIPLTDKLNNITYDCHWSFKLGSANITPGHKQEPATDIGNYITISVLPPVSKVSEKLLCEELSDYTKDTFYHYFVALENDSARSMH